MGGIYGLVGMADQNLFRRMGERIKHRGKFRDEYVDKLVAFGHRDFLKAEIHRGDTRAIVAFDGEIYNQHGLVQELSNLNVKVSADCQSELVLKLYETYGLSFAEKITGPFACVLWDQARNSLILARDPVGERPLYYWTSAGLCIFASEIKSILCFEQIEPSVDMEALDFFLSYGHTPVEKSLFNGIKRVLPGTLIAVKNGQTEKRTFNLLDYGSNIDFHTTPNEWCDILYRTMMSAVEMRLKRSPHPIGILLGGIDSATIASMMVRLTDDPIHAFTVSYDEEQYNEPSAHSAADHLGLDYHESVLKPRDAIKCLDDLAWIYDDLVADLYTSIPTRFILEHSARYVRTVFAGDLGGILAGEHSAGKYGSSYSLGSKIPRLARARIIRHSMRNRPNLARREPFDSLEDFVRSLAVRISPDVKFLSWWSFFNEKQLELLYAKNLRNREFGDIAGPFREVLLKESYPAWAEVQTELVNYCRMILRMMGTGGFWIPRTERIGSTLSLHTARPYLDRSVIEASSKIPPALKVSGEGETKLLLRQTCMKYELLPREIVYQRKVGYACPIEPWLVGELKEFVEQTIADGCDELRGILDPNAMTHVALHGTPHQKYAILMLILWHKRFFH
jgi:asparagine synthase (glutamine-hydrolysing)